jgi:hypothetical protein
MKKYNNQKTNKSHEFTYSWAYAPYFAGEQVFKMCVIVEPKEKALDYPTLQDYPELYALCTQMCSFEYVKGQELDYLVGTFGFFFVNEDDFKQKTEIIADCLRQMEVPYSGKIDRLSGFPSIEFGNDVITHLFGKEFTSLTDIEDWLGNVCKHPTPLVEYMGEMDELPIKCEHEFSPNKDTPVTALDSQVNKMIEETKRRVAKAEAARAAIRMKEVNVATTDTKSDEYKRFESAWL